MLCAVFGLLAAACAGEPVQLPARSPPPREMPNVAWPPYAPAPGSGRVVLHGTDGPMHVVAQADASFVPPGHSVPPTRTGDLCQATPCVADLPVGRYKLYLTSADGSFSHGDTDDITVTEGVTYYVRAPGRYEPPEWLRVYPVVLVTAAAAMAVTGIVLAAENEGTPRTAGLVMIGGGVVLGVWGGIELYDASRAKQQEGATTIWRP